MKYSESLSCEVMTYFLRRKSLSDPCPRAVEVKVLVAQSCPTLWGPRNRSPRGSSVHGMLQARILERVAIPFSRDLPNPGIEPGSPAMQADFLSSQPPGK